MRRVLAFAPAAVFAALVLVFGFFALKHNPQVVPRATVGKLAPNDALPGLDGAAPAPLKTALKGVTLINFFASWCGPCAEEAPTLYTTNIRKDERGGRIFIDTLRNARSASAVAPWSTRALPGAPVATPLTWAELPKAKPQDFTVATVKERLTRSDPWADMPSIGQTISAAAKKALGL